MTAAISHHFDPQVYLRQFTSPKAKNELWEYDLATGIGKKSTPKDCGCEDYYNSVALEGGGRDDETLETAFHPLENALPKLFKAIRNKESMTDNLWSLFFTFAAIQDARSPARVGAIDDFLSQIHQVILEVGCNNSPKFQKAFASLGVDPAKVPDYVEMKASKGSALLHSLQPISMASQIFGGMKWNFIYAPPGKFFFTSDNPICRWTPLERRKTHGEGLTDQDIGITFPLSLRVCACVDLKNNWTDTHNDISAEAVDTINHHTVRNARHFIYGPTMDAQIAELVQEKFKKRQTSCQQMETK